MTREKKSLLRKKTSSKVAKKTLPKVVAFKRKRSFKKTLSGNDSLLYNCSSDKNTSEFCRRSSDLVHNKNSNDNDLISIVNTQEAYKELFSRYQKKLFAYIFIWSETKMKPRMFCKMFFQKCIKI